MTWGGTGGTLATCERETLAMHAADFFGSNSSPRQATSRHDYAEASQDPKQDRKLEKLQRWSKAQGSSQFSLKAVFKYPPSNLQRLRTVAQRCGKTGHGHLLPFIDAGNVTAAARAKPCPFHLCVCSDKQISDQKIRQPMGKASGLQF